MQNLTNKNIDKWERPWNREKFDGLYDEDDRFMSIVIKGALSFLTRNIVMYNKPIKHFILSTGSSYMYVETNGYEYSTSEISGEDYMYMSLPRCLVELDGLSIPTEELTQPFVRGTYERKLEDNTIVGMNAEMRRLPIEIKLKCKYVLSNFNESVILLEEIMSKLVFMKYYNVVYLGNVIKCSIDFPTDESIEINKIDMTSSDVNQKTIEMSLTIKTSYPQINEMTEQRNNNVMGNFTTNLNLYSNMTAKPASDTEKYYVE